MTTTDNAVTTKPTRAMSSSWVRTIIWLVVTAVLAFSPWLGLSPANSRKLVLIAMLALVVSSLNLSFGFAGELSFAQAAMYAVGAYITAIVAMNWVNDLLLTLIISAIGGLFIGFITGIPGLRLGGWMLAITSFYMILLVPDIVSLAKKWTGGHQGLSGIPVPELFGHQLSTDQFLIAVVVVTSLWFALFRNFVMSRTGSALTVLRQSPVLASSLGISVYSVKLKAYTLSGLPAAMGGTFFAYLDGFIAPESFNVHYAIVILAAGILGGTRSVYGVFIGAALMQLGPMQSSSFGDYAFVAYGVFLIVAGVLLQRGIAGVFNDLKSKWEARREPPVVISDEDVEPPANIELPPMAGEPLQISGINKAFGGVAALKDVSFDVQPGEVVALIGPNGSGKTTLLNVISGYYKADSGTVSIGSVDITGKAPHKVARARIARTFQTPNIPDMSVRDAVIAARMEINKLTIIETMFRMGRYSKVTKGDQQVVDQLLEAVGLSEFADFNAQSLPLGTRRLLELARSLASEPALLLLDEVASGLDDEEIEELSRLVRAVRAAGGSILLVEHNFSLVRSLADRVAVLSQGSLVTIETPEAVARHPEVLEHYLGQPASTITLDDEDEA